MIPIPTEPVRVDDYGKTPCQCQIVTDLRDRFDAIRYCPTHAQAFAMLAALRAIVEARCDCDYDLMPVRHAQGLTDARAILRTVKEA